MLPPPPALQGSVWRQLQEACDHSPACASLMCRENEALRQQLADSQARVQQLLQMQQQQQA